MEEQPKKNRRLPLSGRHVYAAVIGAGLVALLFFVAYPRLLDTQANRRSDLLQQHARLLQSINSLPGPSGMQPGIQNSQARFIVEESSRQAESAAQAASQIRLSLTQRTLSRLTPQSPLSEVVQSHNSYTEVTQSVQADVSQYTQTLNAMLRLVEYNPEVDMQGYNPDSNETEERLRRLENGLSETQQELEELSANNRTDALLDYVNQARQARTNLVESADTESFVQAFTGIQQAVVAELADYHDELQSSSRNQLIELIRQS